MRHVRRAKERERASYRSAERGCDACQRYTGGQYSRVDVIHVDEIQGDNIHMEQMVESKSISFLSCQTFPWCNYSNFIQTKRHGRRAKEEERAERGGRHGGQCGSAFFPVVFVCFCSLPPPSVRPRTFLLLLIK